MFNDPGPQLLVFGFGLAALAGCVVPETGLPSVVPVTNTDSLGHWLPAELIADPVDFSALRTKVATLSGADTDVRIEIAPDGRFHARIPDEVMDRAGGSSQDTLLPIDGTWHYTTDNHRTVGIQFNTSEDPQRAFLGFMHHRKGQLVMIIALGDYDSGNLLVLHPKAH